MDRLVNPGCSSKLPYSDMDELMNSSFLGSGSEILISSVFESTPPVTKGTTTPPKASSVSINESSDEEVVPGSPLAKVFGFGKGRLRPPFSSSEKASRAEVEGLKGELKEVRESQLRMEEMISKMIAGQ
jgi:hypothetical protein